MLTYVMDGNILTAKKSVEPQIERKSDELRLHGDAKIYCMRLPATTQRFDQLDARSHLNFVRRSRKWGEDPIATVQRRGILPV